MTSDDQVERLDQAIDAILSIRAALRGGEAPELPAEALDAALRLHQGYQQARQEFATAVRRLVERTGGDMRSDVFTVESSANQMIAIGAEVAFALGIRLRTGE